MIYYSNDPKIANIMTKTIEPLINEMFKIAGYDLTYDQVRYEDFWDKYTMTKAQEKEVFNYAVDYFKGSSFSRQMASSFIGRFSLKIKN